MSFLLIVLAYVSIFSVLTLALLAAVGIRWTFAIPLSLIIGTILFRWYYLPIPLRRWRRMAAQFGVDRKAVSKLRQRSDIPTRGNIWLEGAGVVRSILATPRGILVWKRFSPVANRLFQPLLIPWDRVTTISFEKQTYVGNTYLTAILEVQDGPYPEVVVDWSRQFNALIPDHVIVNDRTSGPLARFRIDDEFD